MSSSKLDRIPWGIKVNSKIKFKTLRNNLYTSQLEIKKKKKKHRLFCHTISSQKFVSILKDH